MLRKFFTFNHSLPLPEVKHKQTITINKHFEA